MVVGFPAEIEERSALQGVGVERSSVLGGEVGELCPAVGSEVVQMGMVEVEEGGAAEEDGMVGREEVGAWLGEECLQVPERKDLMKMFYLGYL